MPNVPLYLTNEEYGKIWDICKDLDCKSYVVLKTCIRMSLNDYERLKEEIKKNIERKVPKEKEEPKILWANERSTRNWNDFFKRSCHHLEAGSRGEGERS